MNVVALREFTDTPAAEVIPLQAPASDSFLDGVPIDPQPVPEVLLNRPAPKKKGRKKGTRNKPKKAAAPVVTPTPPPAEAAAQPLPIASTPSGAALPNRRITIKVDHLILIGGGLLILALGFGIGAALFGSPV